MTVCVDTNRVSPVSLGGDRVRTIPLFQDTRESVSLEVWSPESRVSIAGHKGLEVFVLEGGFHDGSEHFVRHSWLRLPVGQSFSAVPGPKGATVWIKTDHLAAMPSAPAT